MACMSSAEACLCANGLGPERIANLCEFSGSVAATWVDGLQPFGKAPIRARMGLCNFGTPVQSANLNTKRRRVHITRLRERVTSAWP